VSATEGFGLMAISHQAADDVDQAIDRRVVMNAIRRNIFQLVTMLF